MDTFKEHMVKELRKINFKSIISLQILGTVYTHIFKTKSLQSYQGYYSNNRHNNEIKTIKKVQYTIIEVKNYLEKPK